MSMLDILFGSKLRAKVLGWLFMHPDERYFVRQLTSILKEDSTNVSRELAKLASSGILDSKKEGRQKYYQVDQSCPVFAELRGLVLKTVGLVDILRSALIHLSEKILVAFVHGSFVRGTVTSDSDVDMVVVGDASFGEIVAALHTVQERLQREVNPVVYSAQEFREKLLQGHHFLTEIRDAPKVFLIGDDRELSGLGPKRLAG
jgi:predicted nucleotidyltransferase